MQLSECTCFLSTDCMQGVGKLSSLSVCLSRVLKCEWCEGLLNIPVQFRVLLPSVLLPSQTPESVQCTSQLQYGVQPQCVLFYFQNSKIKCTNPFCSELGLTPS